MNELEKKILLEALSRQNTAGNTLASGFAQQIIDGRRLRDEYAQLSGLSRDDLIKQELHPTISYVANTEKNISTDEPPIIPMGTARGDINLARSPIYRALIQEYLSNK